MHHCMTTHLRHPRGPAVTRALRPARAQTMGDCTVTRHMICRPVAF